MIISIETGQERKQVPYAQDFARWSKNLSNADYKKIYDKLNEMIDSNEIHTSGWMPGSNWMGTDFEPIYHACNMNERQAALFFGLIVYKVFLERVDYWACGRFELNGKAIRSLTYFKVNP